MAKKQEYFFINWIDGMKINKDHFIGMENTMICQQHLGNKFQINPYNFGMFPDTEGEPCLDLSYRADAGNLISIEVLRCKAVTSGGYIINIDKNTSELAEFSIGLSNFEVQVNESISGQFYVVLKINPYNRIPVGIADPEENPPRHPHVLPEYSVYVVPVEQMNKAGFGDFFLVVGKILVKDNIIQPDKDYIPPCSRVMGDERLLAIENKIAGFFSKLEADIMVIIRKIHSKQQKTPLANSVLTLSDKLATFLGLYMTQQRLFLKHLPPVALFEAVSQFARYFHNTLDVLPTEHKEEMINYFSDWCNLRQGELEKLMVETTNSSYNHHEIKSVLSKMESFTDTMSVLFGTLSTLDYIGKRRDTQIYIKEEVKSKKSFLADD